MTSAMLQHAIDERERNNEFLEIVRQMWLADLKFLDVNDNIVKNIECPDKEAVNLFIRACNTEAKEVALETNSRKAKIERRWMSENNPHGITRRDSKSIGAYNDSDSKDTRILTKRALKYKKERDAVIDEVFETRFQLYRMISPHTFCFVPFDPTTQSSYLEQLMNTTLLQTKNFDVNPRGDWIKSPGVTVYKNGRSLANIKLYVSRRSPALKLKFYSKRQGDKDHVDELDVEAQFNGRRYAGIVHYHVQKPYTRKRFLEAEGDEDLKTPAFFEMSHVVRTGEVRIRQRFNKEDEERIWTYKDATEKSIKATKLWTPYPITAGGSLFATAIEVIENEPKYESLQAWALKQ